MKSLNKFRFTTFTAAIVINILSGCSKGYNINTANTQFVLTSTVIKQGRLLTVTFICHGESYSLLRDRYGYPKGTKGFASDLQHEASPAEIHSYWRVYNIPFSVTHLPLYGSGFGIFG